MQDRTYALLMGGIIGLGGLIGCGIGYHYSAFNPDRKEFLLLNSRHLFYKTHIAKGEFVKCYWIDPEEYVYAEVNCSQVEITDKFKAAGKQSAENDFQKMLDDAPELISAIALLSVFITACLAGSAAKCISEFNARRVNPELVEVLIPDLLVPEAKEVEMEVTPPAGAAPREKTFAEQADELNIDEDDIPVELRDTLSRYSYKLMNDPYVLFPGGHTVDKSVIPELKCCPYTRQPIERSAPNVALRKCIRTFLATKAEEKAKNVPINYPVVPYVPSVIELSLFRNSISSKRPERSVLLTSQQNDKQSNVFTKR